MMDVDKTTGSLLRSIRFVVFDFDGVFTDNRVLVGQDGRESVFCSRADGLGLEALVKEGVPALVLSTEVNPVVTARAAKLKLECVQGCTDKWTELERILTARAIPVAFVAFMGNDVNDAECLRRVGLPICVADAHLDVLPLAKLVTTKSGGHGAVREVCDMIIQARRPAGRSGE